MKNVDNENDFKVLRELNKRPNKSQRAIADEIGFSLGKLNYVINALKEKGLIKIENFKKNPNKICYTYILTPKGIKTKTKLAINFMNRKMREYEELKKELEEN